MSSENIKSEAEDYSRLPVPSIADFSVVTLDPNSAEQNLVQQQLKEQLQIINLTHEAILILGLDGAIQFWNQGAEEMFGFTAAEALGQISYELLQTEFPKPREEIQSMIFRTGRWDGELVHRARSGEAMTVASRWAVRCDTNGKPSSFLELDRDINERKKAERKGLRDKVDRELLVEERIVELAASDKLLNSKSLEIEKSDEQRELRVQERIVELAASEKLLRSKMLEIEKSDEQRELRVQERIVELAASEELLRSKVMELVRSNEELQQFAYVCSHDLQEPLRVISNYSQLLSRRYLGKIDAKADQYIAFAVDAAKRMQILIHDLLAFSRLQTSVTSVASVDCNKVVQMALANLEILITEADATVQCDELPTVAGDESQLLQVFQNLIANALKFRSKEAVFISISAHQEDNFWIIAVADNGIGFDLKFEERIFLIFQRLHTREEYSGSGIGLAVCKKIILRHGGKIWVESGLGKGSKFFFSLPVLIPENKNG